MPCIWLLRRQTDDAASVWQRSRNTNNLVRERCFFLFGARFGKGPCCKNLDARHVERRQHKGWVWVVYRFRQPIYASTPLGRRTRRQVNEIDLADGACVRLSKRNRIDRHARVVERLFSGHKQARPGRRCHAARPRRPVFMPDFLGLSREGTGMPDTGKRAMYEKSAANIQNASSRLGNSLDFVILPTRMPHEVRADEQAKSI